MNLEVRGAPFKENNRMNLEVRGTPFEENIRMNLELLGFLDGSVPTPSPNVTGSNGITQVNPAYISWLTTDQTLLSLLYSSLTEESMSEDELQLIQQGSKSVAEFSQLFKGLYDQLTAIGRPIDDLDKVH
ncbi:hypothetical protein CK203_023365 [Vitis vinifera]|uniref:Retrotransposon gag domain-containing protein n=1 Tax=Vitis vinifera TaxID=29760 RepID=A0A438J6R5_VITVI|nr:hypothetical protein CK203_023365 [Vitis vinifera]